MTSESKSDDAGREGGTDSGDLCQLVERTHGITVVAARSLGGELDTNVWIRDSQDREYTIKRSTCGDPQEIRWQYLVLEHLNKRLAGIQVPTLVPTLEGDWDVVCEHGSTWVVVRLANWVPGQVVASHHQPPPRLLREWGLLAANTVLALSDFDPGSVPSTHYWDLRDSLVAVESCLEFVEDRENRLAVERLMEGSDAVIEKFEQLPQQVIHHDLNDFNVLISEVSTEARVTGLLDVGDTLFAPRLSELIVASAYAMLRQPQPLSAVDQVIGGYAEILPLPDAEYDIVRQLSGLRLCVNATTWTKRASLEGTMYGQRRMAETWPTIRTLAKVIG